MALYTCESCGGSVSTASKTCANCGASNPRYNLPQVLAIYIVLFILFTSCFLFVVIKKAKAPTPGGTPPPASVDYR